MPGQDWNREIGTWRGDQKPPLDRAAYEKRARFYQDRVKFKLKEEYDDVMADLKTKGFLNMKDHRPRDGSKNWDHEVKAEDTLFTILKDFYRNKFNLDPAKAEQEAYLSLAHLMKSKQAKEQLGNVDELQVGGKVVIREGYLSSVSADHKETALYSVPLRPVMEEAYEYEPAPSHQVDDGKSGDKDDEESDTGDTGTTPTSNETTTS